jgi:hypothetical protein
MEKILAVHVCMAKYCIADTTTLTRYREMEHHGDTEDTENVGEIGGSLYNRCAIEKID